jgi:hypothetical protein
MLAMQPDWFAQLTGFRETSYDAQAKRLVVRPLPPQQWTFALATSFHD